MVFVYGGGWTIGSASLPLYGGENLAKKGAVVVSFNYRVGALGFFAHPELTAEGPGAGSTTWSPGPSAAGRTFRRRLLSIAWW